mmetsp:Transcript_10994/g.27863  ORF Transcript_10994/g.27863 Transcript_10994/m.27863 type:complete len:165 (-) Transcript_10994:202-696(-)
MLFFLTTEAYTYFFLMFAEKPYPYFEFHFRSRQENINQNGTNTNNSSFQGHQQQNQTIQAIPTQNISPNIPYASGVVLTEPQRSQNLIPTVHATILPAVEVEVDAYAYAVVFEDRQPQTQMAVPTAVAYYSHAQAYPVNDDQQPTPTTSNGSEFGMGNLHLCEE